MIDSSAQPFQMFTEFSTASLAKKGAAVVTRYLEKQGTEEPEKKSIPDRGSVWRQSTVRVEEGMVER